MALQTNSLNKDFLNTIGTSIGTGTLPVIGKDDNGKVVKIADGEYALGIDESVPDTSTASKGDVLTVGDDGAIGWATPE